MIAGYDVPYNFFNTLITSINQIKTGGEGKETMQQTILNHLYWTMLCKIVTKWKRKLIFWIMQKGSSGFINVHPNLLKMLIWWVVSHFWPIKLIHILDPTKHINTTYFHLHAPWPSGWNYKGHCTEQDKSITTTSWLINLTKWDSEQHSGKWRAGSSCLLVLGQHLLSSVSVWATGCPFFCPTLILLYPAVGQKKNNERWWSPFLQGHFFSFFLGMYFYLPAGWMNEARVCDIESQRRHTRPWGPAQPWQGYTPYCDLRYLHLISGPPTPDGPGEACGGQASPTQPEGPAAPQQANTG